MKFIVSLLAACIFSAWSFGQSAPAGTDTISVKKTDSLTVNEKPVLKNGKHIDDMISFAKTFLGTPYRYSGSSPSGFDCSGFINYVMGGFGFSLPRSSYAIAELGKTVKLSEVQPGDLLFFKGRNINSTTVGHVAMVVEANEHEIKMIHSSTSRGVIIENFKNSKYYIPRFIKAKRMEYTRD
ncbi:C40 family peptidase [Crocinitomicaceae bacterium CZZ-1]|uniref:C40 family peptidase n=1 Tax=Taishania pollutisoli TaxID=2766479 RepID=A0A8J6P697_9FLAO|nr:C40 family peptidase [Taishania pollutisoli]MBC9812649.1 C40 family peptidase [Taishania pollutisoli]MBX2949196.1 C40 family peptidase [Crocinitomicaceae bacterium]NGF75872.1 C40 family peptidase [Fluviicola sp. SGL-29]